MTRLRNQRPFKSADRPGRNPVLAALGPLLPAIGLGAIFLVCAVVAILTTRANAGIALLWPGNAIVAALLIRMRHVRWSATAVAIFVAGACANRLLGHDASQVAIALTAVNMVEIAAMVYVFRVAIPLPFPKLTILQAAYMTLIMGILIPGATALLGGAVLHVMNDVPLWDTAQHWWASDALGACLLAPPIILYSKPNLQRLLRPQFFWQNLLMLPMCMVATYLAVR
ncbi:MAG: MASE1 domain-containing protein, partial [Steroidobacteraceae bacterium]